MATVSVFPDRPLGFISPRLYGHFAEHLGRCCYDGLWVSGAARQDVLEALRSMPTPFLRWPGGCYADHYHWRDGIGPSRPVRLGLSCGLSAVEDNSLGTHEFLSYCEAIGAEPYLAGNMGSGSVQEMCDWVEYCNTPHPTSLGLERSSNGRSEPFGVKVWGVGNENWGCGGHYTAESYGLEYRRYATMLRPVDPSAELVVCGFLGEWNARLLETLKGYLDHVDHFSIHQYWTVGGPGSSFSEADYYRLLAEATATEEFVKETRALLDVASPNRFIGIALDEWGVWHPEARNWGDRGCAGPDNNYEQACTLRDALAANAALEGFHRQCKSLSLANLAQVVNVLHAPIRTSGSSMWLTPTYHLFQLHEPHVGATAVETSCASELAADNSPAVTCTASVQDGSVALTLMNRHFTDSVTVSISLPGASVSGRLLASSSAADENSAVEPDKVSLKPLEVRRDGELWQVTLPKHSVATLVAS